jgi:hypothetical protein
LFRLATGWLGWSPDQALNTPVPQIEMALDGRVEWVRKTNPFGAPEKPVEEPKVSVGERLRKAFSTLGTKAE